MGSGVDAVVDQSQLAWREEGEVCALPDVSTIQLVAVSVGGDLSRPVQVRELDDYAADLGKVGGTVISPPRSHVSARRSCWGMRSRSAVSVARVA